MLIEPVRRARNSFRICLTASIVILLTMIEPTSGEALHLALVSSGIHPDVVYDASRDHCDPIDTPDIPARAFRDASGTVTMFALHFINRPLRGPDLLHLKIDCHVALGSGGDADPAHFNDRRYLTATWTTDGMTVGAVIHNEYHADKHHRCAVNDYLGCWYNSLIGLKSGDGANSFDADTPTIVASAPFKADVEVGRHRGFFNPSNIVSDGHYFYFLAATTGWDGQAFGACLFRSIDATDPRLWRAWDGRLFSIHYTDPYRSEGHPKPCAIIDPFKFPVGGIVKHNPTHLWLAVWMASADSKTFPVDGFYYSVSSDLKNWSMPGLLKSGRTLLDAGCNGPVIAYPTLMDPDATGRNFDNIGNDPYLYFTTTSMHDCQTANRQLVRQQVRIIATPSPGLSQ